MYILKIMRQRKASRQIKYAHANYIRITVLKKSNITIFNYANIS